MDNKSIRHYRKDIDGLRGVAVSLVILYRVWFRFSAGFLGVDVFFVISGFLITLLVLDELGQGRFSFRSFYLRRVRRILPAFLLVLGTVLLLGWIFFLPSEFLRLGKYALASLGFFENVQLSKESGYFTVSSIWNPLHHIWSLSIEEQYYLIWPMALVFLFKLKPILNAAWDWAAILVLALACGILATRYPVNSFLFLQGRAWELSVGACLAIGETHLERCRGKKLGGLLSCVGLGLILAASLGLLSNGNIYVALFRGESWPVIAAVLGAAMVIMGGSKAWVNDKILGQRALVWLGIVSYSLYLWHWPIFSLISMISPEGDTVPLRLVGVFLAIVLAGLTYAYLEYPCRRAPNFRLIGVAAAILIVVSFSVAHSWVPPRLRDRRLSEDFAARSDWSSPPTGFANGSVVTYRLGQNKAKTILFIGDSHSSQYWPRVQYLYSQPKPPSYSVLFASFDGCLLYSDMTFEGTPCPEVNASEWKLALDPDVRRVVIASYWEVSMRYAEGRGYADLRRKLQQLTAAGKTVDIILSNPTGRAFGPEPVAFSRWTGLPISSGDPVKMFGLRAEPVLSRLVKAVEMKGVRFIDPMRYICPGDACAKGSPGGRAINIDDDHLRASYVRLHAMFIDEIFN